MKTQRKKILFICKNRECYGEMNFRNFGLVNSASFVCNALNNAGDKAELKVVQDANDIDRVVSQSNPDIVILEALFVTPEKMTELLSLIRHKRRTWVIRIHSKLSFLAHEGMAIDWLSRYPRVFNLYISANDDDLSDNLQYITKANTSYLPNIYCPNGDINKSNLNPIKRDGIMNVGCFGSIRPMKNHLTAAVAAIKFADSVRQPLVFHINGYRTEQGGNNCLKNITSLFKDSPHTLICHPWYEHSDFLYVIRQMDIGLQLSLSETFNIVVADFVDNNVPIVVSHEIDWLPFIVKADPNSVDNIVSVMYSSLNYYSNVIKKLCKDRLLDYNSVSLKTWQTFCRGT